MKGSHALKASSLTPRDVARFWSKVEVKQYGCWPWRGSRQPAPKDYGTFKLNGESEQAHRIAWALFNGEAPADLSICHDCDDPPCCRPDHMFAGTNADNVADSVRKERPRGPGPGVDSIPPEKRARGEAHFKTTLTETQVRRLRLEALRGVPRAVLVEKYKVSTSTIGQIITRKTWKHVK